jgi:hypothetical protein
MAQVANVALDTPSTRSLLHEGLIFANKEAHDSQTRVPRQMRSKRTRSQVMCYNESKSQDGQPQVSP